MTSSTSLTTATWGAYTYAKGSWGTQPQLLAGLSDSASISCSGPSFCVAVGEGQNGDGNNAYVYSG